MKRIKLLPALFVFFSLFATTSVLAAQESSFDFYSRGPYNSQVSTPSALLGYQAGSRHTQYDIQQRVLEQMAVAAPDRIRFETIGVTEEGRTMRSLIISSSENISRIDEIRENNARLANPAGLSRQEAQTIAENTPVIVMLSYSIHGYEAAGFEAAIWVAYQLLASNNPATLSSLENTVVVMHPAANPDGHERLAVWYNSLPANTADEPRAFHSGQGGQPWEISGRYSHYRFDMNRDLIAQTQQPTRAIVGSLTRWNPQVYVDLHSTTSQYFFPPVAQPVNQNLPGQSFRWMETFGRGNAAAFDAEGWTYFTREIFDFFYPGYFDAFPSFMGATGMTYETDGGPQLAIRKQDGRVVTFRDGIARHFVASLTTLETAGNNATDRQMDYYEFHRSAIEEGAAARMKRVVIDPGNGVDNAARAASILLRSGVQVTQLTQAYTARSSHSYMGDDTGSRQTFQPGALVIDLSQSQGILARTLLEPRSAFDSLFVADHIGRYERNQRRGDNAEREGYDFYDVTAWALPYTMGLDAYWTEDLTAVQGVALQLPEHGDVVLVDAAPAPGPARAAYVFENDRRNAVVLAMQLLDEGFTLGISERPLRADGRSYPRGTFVARVARNPEQLHERIAALATHTGVEVDAVNSAFPDSGGVGVGSNRIRLVRAPKVLVAAGRGISQTSFGALWHYLETELHLDFVPVALDDFGGMRTITDYNVLIIPSGSSGRIQRELGSRGIDRLKNWVRDGGVIIAYDGSGLFLSDEDVGMSSVSRVGDDDDDDDDGDDDDDEDEEFPSGPEQSPPLASPTAGTSGPAFVPGAIFRSQLDMTHWLTLGYTSAELPVMIYGSEMFKPSEEGDNPAAFVGDNLTLGGFTWPDNTERYLQGSVWATVERFGSGKIVQFASDPLFRGFWRGPAKMLTNAMLIGTGR
jgi:hypothetical protein